jgi:hypothetical protein
MKFTDFLPQESVILGLAERVRNKYPEKCHCAQIAKELTSELKARGIPAKHVVGNFVLDFPGSFHFVSKPDEETDDYTVNHDWVEVEGKIIDAAASQFRKYVDCEIPDVAVVGFSNPLYVKYHPLKYV